MQSIYLVNDNYYGHKCFCLKTELDDTINAYEARMKTNYMNENKLTPKTADVVDLNCFCSDYLEIDKFNSEHELIAALND